jgi:hypothetical protein
MKPAAIQEIVEEIGKRRLVGTCVVQHHPGKLNLVVVVVVVVGGRPVDDREGRFPGGGRSQKTIERPPT